MGNPLPVWLRLKAATPISSLAVRKAILPVAISKIETVPYKTVLHLQFQSQEDANAAVCKLPTDFTALPTAHTASKGTVFSRELADWAPDDIKSETANFLYLKRN